MFACWTWKLPTNLCVTHEFNLHYAPKKCHLQYLMEMFRHHWTADNMNYSRRTFKYKGTFKKHICVFTTILTKIAISNDCKFGRYPQIHQITKWYLPFGAEHYKTFTWNYCDVKWTFFHYRTMALPTYSRHEFIFNAH